MVRTAYWKHIDPYEDVHHPESGCPIRQELIEKEEALWYEVPEPKRTAAEIEHEIDAANQTIRFFDEALGMLRVLTRCNDCFDIWHRRTNQSER